MAREGASAPGSLRSPVRWVARSAPRAFLALFLLAVVLRLATFQLIHPDQIPPNPNWESGAITISLVESGRFADPYLIPTGPTAHLPPTRCCCGRWTTAVIRTQGSKGGACRTTERPSRCGSFRARGGESPPSRSSVSRNTSGSG